tara:strand:+ start:500 stop:868 length:369 start_codon:yes stop_codon:yes gene_type:complete
MNPDIVNVRRLELDLAHPFTRSTLTNKWVQQPYIRLIDPITDIEYKLIGKGIMYILLKALGCTLRRSELALLVWTVDQEMWSDSLYSILKNYIANSVEEFLVFDQVPTGHVINVRTLDDLVG